MSIPKFKDVCLRDKGRDTGKVGKVIVTTDQGWTVEIKPLSDGSMVLSWGKGERRRLHYIDR